jgi:ech hydrogenase subunit D
MAQESINIVIEELTDRAFLMHSADFRLAQISATAKDGGVEINYSFDRDYHLVHLRLGPVSLESEIPSIAKIYPNAFIYENELADLFGIKIKGMPVDYKGNFYRIAVKYPFKPQATKDE